MVEDQELKKSNHRYAMIPRTLIFITHDDKLLLLKGAPDKQLWAGLYNGVGGHIERGENVRQSASRELFEETGLEIDDLKLEGIITIDVGQPNQGIMLFVFTGESPTNKVQPSIEGNLEWIDKDNLPESMLVPDIPALLAHIKARSNHDQPFFGRYWYDSDDILQIELEG